MHSSILLLIASLTLASCQKAENMAAQQNEADRLTNLAVTFADGDYVLENVKTGQIIQYEQSGQQMWPADSDGDPVTFETSPNGPYTRLSAGNGNVKCLSAQWSYDIGADHAGVLYACAVGSHAGQGSKTLELPKQWWLFIPVDGGDNEDNTKVDVTLDVEVATNSTEGDSDPDGDGCAKSRDWIRRHPLYVRGPKYNHVECAHLLRPYQLHAIGFNSSFIVDLFTNQQQKQNRRSINLFKKRAATDATSGTYTIVALDHLTDMTTRALVGETKTIEGSKATVLAPWDDTDTLQHWIVRQAN